MAKKLHGDSARLFRKKLHGAPLVFRKNYAPKCQKKLHGASPVQQKSATALRFFRKKFTSLRFKNDRLQSLSAVMVCVSSYENIYYYSTNTQCLC